MFYDHGYLNFIAFILASFKLSIIQAAMNIDYEQFLALDGGRKTEEAWNKQAFPKPSGKITIISLPEMRASDASLCFDFNVSVLRTAWQTFLHTSVIINLSVVSVVDSCCQSFTNKQIVTIFESREPRIILFVLAVGKSLLISALLRSTTWIEKP